MLETFIQELGLGRFVLAVHATSGPVGLQVAAARPEPVRGLIIANTFAWPLLKPPTAKRAMEVLHPPEPETPQETTTKAYRALRRSVSLLEQALRHLSDLVPSWKRSAALKAALTTLDQEVDRVGSRLASKSLIVASGVSFP